MKPALTKRFIDSQQWYRQAGAALPWFISVPWSSTLKLTARGRTSGLSFGNIIVDLADEQVAMFWSKRTMRRVARWYVRRQLLRPGFMEKLHGGWRRTQLHSFRAAAHSMQRFDIRRADDAELRERFIQFTEQYYRVWQEAIFHDAFDLAAGELLEQALAREHKAVKDKDITVLLEPNEPLAIQIERSGIARIARRAGRSRTLQRLFLRRRWYLLQNEYPALFRSVVRHRDAYFWMYNDYAHIRDLSVNFFLDRIRHHLVHPGEMRFDASIATRLVKLRVRKRALLKRLRLNPATIRLLSLLSTVQVWRDERKAMNQQAGAVMRKFATELSRRSGLPYRLVVNACAWEFNDILKPSARFRAYLQARAKGATYATVPPHPEVAALGKRRRWLLAMLRRAVQGELKGLPAYPGVVKGRARLVLRQRDFPSFRQGEILLAPNTRPEYVPIMKKASAIVTEEGGITSHAAIVSRELSIPAVVGVQGVLDVIRDGDRIEVDANSGTVRKLP